MKIASLNSWLTLFANFGVIMGIVFLAIEIRQNTMALNREIELSSLEYSLGRFVESDHLPNIAAKVAESSPESDSTRGIERTIMEEFNLSTNEAARWWRWVISQWLRDEVDWKYTGENREGCAVGAIIREQNGNQLLWEFFTSNNSFSDGYVECVENYYSPARAQ